MKRRNKNRGYQQLIVWQDAVAYYKLTAESFRPAGFEMGRIVSQQLASADSVHRNIAEGYCRRSIKEYIHYLYIALGSLGESVSAQFAYLEAGQLSPEEYEKLDALAYKIENGMLRLVQSIELKRDQNDWTDTLIVEESNATYNQ
ncbi:MAG: four helix bundle protein [Puniceicoccaceae bacterium]|nr:MAG: four helix bundle protein [Puniceicoccaceae bacterium]